MELFPSILSKYEIVPDLTAIDDTFGAVYRLAFKLDGEIRSASKSDSDETPVSAYDTAASADTVAKATADGILADVLSVIAESCEANPNVAFHLAAEIKNVSQFVTSEVNYARRLADRSLPADKRSDAMDVKRSDRKELVVFLRNFWQTFTPLQVNVPSGVEVKDGKLVLPNLQGRQNGETAVPTGRYAKLYSLRFSVGDETFPLGTDPFLVVRTIWTGADRVGKKLADLYDPYDKARNGKAHEIGTTVSFEVNGMNVSAEMVAADSDE